MPANRFKVGDRVRIVRANRFNGEEGEIVAIEFDINVVRVGPDAPSFKAGVAIGYKRRLYAYRLELIDDASSFVPEDWS